MEKLRQEEVEEVIVEENVFDFADLFSEYCSEPGPSGTERT